MHFYVLTLFPDLIHTIAGTSITGRAIKNGTITVDTVDIRDFAVRKTGRIDDYPYGGGAGLVIEAEPVFQAVESVRKKTSRKTRVVYLTPQAQVLTQTKVEELAGEEELILLCGHYEGIDDRVLEEVVTDYISIGDYVLTGGELGAAVLIDAVSRFVPGVLNNEESSQFESLQDNLLEYPQYTRPEVWHDKAVPGVLLTGDHAKIEAYRRSESLKRTKERRPDLLEKSYRISALVYGPEETRQRAERLISEMSRYGAVLDYDRKKLQKTRRTVHYLDLYVIPTGLETEISFAERFRNLIVTDTEGRKPLAVLITCGEDKGEKAFLENKGFSVLAQIPESNLADDRVAATALGLRERIDRSV